MNDSSKDGTEIIAAIELPHPKQALLSLPTTQLLDKFGSGSHSPGSGSAAALHGLLACKLTYTVCQLTRGRPTYREKHAEMEVIQEQIQRVFEPELKSLFQQDSDVFDRVIQLRRARNEATDAGEKRRHADAARVALQLATEIPIGIARTCLSIARFALTAFDVGFQAARGDAGVAVSSALAGANGALCVAYLNLTTFREGEWAVEKRAVCQELMGQAQAVQRQMFERVTKLRTEGGEDGQLGLTFSLDGDSPEASAI